MKFRNTLTALGLCGAVLLAGCETLSPDTMMQSGMLAAQSYMLSDADVKQVANQTCSQMDGQATIAGPDSRYGKRLRQIADNLGHTIAGTPVNYKVYLNEEPNAWAMANGCVRVYSGLMDLMTDNELEGVVGHELGHVALGHTRKAMQTAYATAAARGAIAATGNTTAVALSRSQIGDLAEELINAQFSQRQETEADNFSFDLLSQRGLNPEGLVTGFEKLARLNGGQSSLFSSHPGSAERAENIRSRIERNP
ncbi:MAG: M48 family metalloprotease [Oceanospirillaceae bacterium]|nr:M48 family metalloprotease [Oceanospirillaceae bacterium]